MKKINRDRIERVARLYASNEKASQALGIAAGSFSRLCRLYGIETPYAQKRPRRLGVEEEGGAAWRKGPYYQAMRKPILCL
ncbi:MAG: hypothetical protein FJY95_05960 [Candidatus Handelsmanbacteria bacterium]|nr:hypothetical protein [Candidatus Handelsmanbacteria bacterium]